METSTQTVDAPSTSRVGPDEWTIDGSKEVFPSFGAASFAAAQAVVRKQFSVPIYKNGKFYRLIRF